MQNVGFSKVINNESGLSLLEVMIVAGLMMVMSLGFATLMKHQNEAQVSVRDRAELTNLQTATRGTASNAAAVQRSLQVIDP
jgi:Tfp pilus assembly protein PilV